MNSIKSLIIIALLAAFNAAQACTNFLICVAPYLW